MYKKGITIEEIIKAVNDSKGFLTFAAEKLGCSYQNIWQRAKRNPELKEAIGAIGEHHLDMAESKLIEAIEKGESWAICFFLKCKGKHRGYVERSEVATVNVVPAKPIIELTSEQRQKLLQGAFQRVMEWAVTNSTLSNATKEELTAWIENNGRSEDNGNN